MMPMLYPADGAYTWGDLADATWDVLGDMTWGELSAYGSGGPGADNGLGVLSDAASCVVTEERNGSYELEMTYPVDGIHYGEIGHRSIITAKPSPGRAVQPFRVYRITRPLGGMVTVYARHISYDLSGVVVTPFAAATLAEALDMLQANAVPADHGFVLETNRGGTGGMEVTAPSSLRSLLGGVEGSVLDTYGGEWEFDGHTAKLWSARGEDRGVTLRYGKNLTSLEQESSCAEVYTAVYPYWTGETGTVTLADKLVPVPGTFGFVRVLPVDLSGSFDTAPSEDDLRAAAEYYILDNKVGVPKVSLKVSFAQLDGETLELCDTVSVIFERLGVRAAAKVVKTAYNVLLDRYDSVEIGESRASIADTIAGQTAEIRSAAQGLDAQKAIVNATGWITGAKGGYVIFKRNAEGQPTEILITDNADPALAQKVWRWNNGGLGFSVSGVNGPYETAITQDGSIVGKFVTAEGLHVNAANINGTLSASQIDADNLHVKSANIDGTLSASQIDADNLHVKSANIDGDIYADHVYASNIQGGTAESGYIASGAISDASNHSLDYLRVDIVNVEDEMYLKDGSGVVILSEGGVKTAKHTLTSWDAIIEGGSGGVAKFG